MATPEDAKVWEEFERQSDNLLLALSSADFSSESNFEECCFADVSSKFIDACRALDSWFIQKRLILTMKRPDYQLADEIATLKKELALKTSNANILRQHIQQYIASIDTITSKLTDGVAYIPDT